MRRIATLSASLLALLFAGCEGDSPRVEVTAATPTPAAVDLYGKNLLVNADAETTQGAETQAPPASWGRTQDVLAMEYGGLPDEWQTGRPGCPDGRKRYFRLALAINEETKSINQHVSLAGIFEDVDGGRVECGIGGWLGGWVGGDAIAALEVVFLDEKDAPISNFRTPDFDPASLPKPEVGRAALERQVANAKVPSGARKIEARLIALRPTGKIDTVAIAAADVLSLVLRKTE